jgi:multiple sugar transport system substrate-binding protein
MKKAKRVIAAVCAVLMVASMAVGCKSQSSASSSSESSSDQKITLRMMWWGSQTRHDQYIAMLKLYMQKNPNVTVSYEYSGFSNYWDKVATMAAAKNLPDVWQNSVAYILSYAQKNQITDLTPYIKNKTINCSDWDKVFVNLGVINGKNYGLTLGNSCYCVLYDPDLFTKAGLTQPSLTWTWDDYLNDCKVIKEKLGIYGDSQCPSNIIEGYFMYLRQNGQIGLFNKTRDGITYNKTDLWVKLFTMEKQLLSAGYVMPIDQSVTMNSIEQTGVATGKAAMLGIVNSNQAVAAAKARGKDLALASYPHMTGEKQNGNFIGPTMFLSLSKTSKYQTQSAKLINYILNDTEANKLTFEEKGVPASAAVRKAVDPTLSVTGQRVSDYVAAMAKVVPAFDNIYPTNCSQVTDLYTKLVQDMMFGRKTLEAAGTEFNTTATSTLKS